MPTTDAIVSAWPGWVALVIGVVLTVNKLAEESEKMANRMGRLGRALRAHALKRQGFDAAAGLIAEAVRVAVAKAREEWEQEENEAIVALDKRLSTVSAITAQQSLDLEQMRFLHSCCLAYADYEATWHNRLTVEIAGKGSIGLDQVPRHYSYYNFEQQFKIDTNWRKWAFDG